MSRNEFKICKRCGKHFSLKSKSLFCSQSCRMKSQWENPEYRKKQSDTRASDEYKENMSKIAKESHSSVYIRNLLSKNSKESWKINRDKHMAGITAEHVTQRKRDIMKERWEDDGYIEIMKKMSKELWNSEEHINKMKKIHNSDEYRLKNSERVKELWKNPEYAKKCLYSGFKHKDYKLPSGRIVKVQGYENFVLDDLLKEYKENDIFIGIKQIYKEIGSIKYVYKSGVHSYYPDFYIKSTNTIIEVKSQWTFNKYKEKNLAKEKACIEQGFNFEFKIINKR